MARFDAETLRALRLERIDPLRLEEKANTPPRMLARAIMRVALLARRGK